MTSEALRVVVDLVDRLGEKAHEAIDEVLNRMPGVECAALRHDWPFWARMKQLSPPGYWRTWGFLTGRGFGKTLAISYFINREVEEGRARQICLMAQDEANAVALQVLGPSGLIATAPPWSRPVWEATPLRLVWPNGAWAIVRTPEVPGKIRGFDYDLLWLSEIQSWPVATREEAMSNADIATRIGLARTVWDSTPKKGNAILKSLLKQAAENPEEHHIVRGTTHENAMNLAPGFVALLHKKYGGTAKGREELDGEMLEEAEGALFKQLWIDRNRCDAPASFRRKVVCVDPAVTNKKGSDTTGIVVTGLMADGRALICRNLSGKHDVGKWAEIVLDAYAADQCNLVLAETNKGGDLVAQNLRAAAKERRLNVIVIGREDPCPNRLKGTVFVRELYARGSKADRAEPVATACERNRVGFSKNADLDSLETTLTSWEPKPNQDSPGDLDAMVHGVVELLDLNTDKPDPRGGFKGLNEVQKQLGGGLSRNPLLFGTGSRRSL